jgi:TorA maturation chaperone TorD
VELADGPRPSGAALATGDSPALEIEHTRLFVGPGRVPASPYGSVYLDGGALMGESTADALRHYGEAGFALAPDAGMLPDHLVVELSFLSVLAEEAARALRAGDWPAARLWLGRRGAFLCDHLGAWAPPLAEAVLAATNEPLYRAAAVSLRELVAADLETLLATVGDPAEARPAPAP